MSKVRFSQVVRYVWGYWRRSPLSLAAMVALMLAATLCDVFMPVLAGRLIDALSGGPEAGLSPALWAFAAFIGLSVVYRALRDGALRLYIHLAPGVMRNVVTDAFHRVQRFSADWHANSFAGATVRRITRGMWAFDLFADTVYIGFFPTAVVMAGVTAVLFARWPLMGLAVAGAIAVYVAVSVLLTTRYVAPANRVTNECDSAVGAALADAISCNPTVKSFGAEAREDRRFLEVAGSWRSAAARSWGRSVDVAIAQSLLGVLMLVCLLGLVVWFWSQGRATPGDVALVMTSAFLVNGYLREVGTYLRDLQKAVNEMDDIIRFTRMPLGVEDRPGAGELAARAGEIRFERVIFRYGNQAAPLYRDFSLTIAPGEKVALVGRSGSGKSTFVKLVQRLYDIEGGRIRIDGQDIAAVRQESLRRAVALVPQEPILFHRSLAENIAYGRPEASQAEIVRAARQAHAHEFIEHLTQGYDTLVGERGVKLSGGERQRVAIARAFLADAPILILDEATSSLDSVTEGMIQEALGKLMAGRTTIIIAHRLSTVRQVDRILVFDRGRVVEQGSHATLLDAPEGRYRELYAVQTQSLAS